MGAFVALVGPFAGKHVRGLGLAALVTVVGCHSAEDGCQSDLHSFACAATFDGTEENLPACPVGYIGQTILSCGDSNVVRYTGPGGLDCVYDSATHDLVGASVGTDVVPTDCPGGITAGRVPDSSCFSTAAPQLSCPATPSDAGVD